MSKLTDKIAEVSRPAIESLGLKLWDVEYLREGGQRYLRVYIDRAEGVSLDDCESVSKLLDPILDELDPIEESYIFEVSSAGAERQLKRPVDFEMCIGRSVLVKLYRATDGKKEFSGTLNGYDSASGDVTLEIGGTAYRFAKADIAKAQLNIITKQE
jgi:ribosome maturation factor RimP